MTVLDTASIFSNARNVESLKSKKLNEMTTEDVNREIVEEVNQKTSAQEAISELMNNEDFKNMWIKMHTPYINKLKLTGYKTGRNEICPFCTSGKKFKNCACYKVYKNESYLTGIDAHNAKEQLGKLRTNG